ncbi:MAG: hypothetical protein RIC35_09595 [Marinoscillum sp.]
MKKKYKLFIAFFGLLNLSAFAQLELHLGYSQPINDWAAADITKDVGYANGGMVLQFGGPLSNGDVVRTIINAALGYNAMSSERFGENYAKAFWNGDVTVPGDSLISVKAGTYLYFTTHFGLEAKISLGDNYIPIRVMAGPHIFMPPDRSTVKTYENSGNVETEYRGDWSYDVMGASYQIGTGFVLDEKLSFRVEYFGTLGQLARSQFPNPAASPRLFPKHFQSLFFSVGIIF